MQGEFLQNTLAVLAVMAEAEVAVGELYKVCAQKWPEDRGFWEYTANQEAEHAAAMKRMASLIEKSPDEYSAGRPFSPVAVQTFIRGVNTHRERIGRGEVPKRQAFFIARDIEQSILENKITEIARTANAEYNGLIKRIVNDTAAHLEAIKKKCFETPA